MSKYLRPETLFGPKFEGYLNQQPRKPVKQQKPANKFHNFITSDTKSEIDMEALARKKMEQKLKEIADKRSAAHER